MGLWKRYAILKAFRLISIGLLATVALELALGAANPLMEFTPFVRAAHLSVATVIQGLVVALASLLWVTTRTIEDTE